MECEPISEEVSKKIQQELMEMKFGKPSAQDFQRWVKFLEDVLEWVSNIDCERPAGVRCSRIDLRGGEEACMPCRCKEAYEKIVIKNK